MLDNEFDQFFRDRLLDHSSKIRLTLWKQLHTHLLRHKAVHLWKWYFVGPSAVVVAVTGFFIVKTIQSSSPSKHTAPVTAVAAYESRPSTDSPATQPTTAIQPTTSSQLTTTAQPTTTTQATTPAQPITTLDSPAANPSPTPANPSPTAANPSPTPAARTASSAATRTASTAAAATNAAAAATPTTGTSPASEPLHRSTANSPSRTHTAQDLAAHLRSPTPTNTRAHTHHHPLSGSHNKKAADAMAGDAEDTRVANNAQTANDPQSPNGTAGAHNTRPRNTRPDITKPGITRSGNTGPGITRNRDATQPAPVKLITLKTPAVVTAKTPNSKTPHQLIVPAPRSRTHIPFYVDLFGAPEYFTWKTIGLSYGAGARVTVIFKNHWTITSGVQYLRINVNRLENIDSLSGLRPGYFTNFHIPLLLGYTTGNDRFTFSVNAGVLFSLYTQANGALKEADDWPNRDGLSSYLGINVSTHITNRVSLFAEPYLKCWYPPGDQRLPPQLWSTGLTVGFRYKF